MHDEECAVGAGVCAWLVAFFATFFIVQQIVQDTHLWLSIFSYTRRAGLWTNNESNNRKLSVIYIEP